MSNQVIVVFIILLIVVLWCIKQSSDGFKTITASDGEMYPVLETKNSVEAAKLLSRLNAINIKLMRHLREECPDDPRTKLLLARYNPNVIREHLPTIATPETSFVQNKGEKTCFCLREGKSTPTKNSGFDSFNTLLFVDLHEMSHLAEKAYGHPPSYWKTFKFILREAEKAGVYEPINYARYPEYYCGLHIAYNPYYDNTL